MSDNKQRCNSSSAHLLIRHLCCLFALCCVTLLSCNKKKAEDLVNPVPAIIYDTDIGSSTDDLFGLEMLYNYQGQGRCRLLGVVVDREGEDCAACADVMNTYFGYSVPIGLVRSGIANPQVWIDYREMPSYVDNDNNPMFGRTNLPPYPDGWQLYRQLLAAEPDHSVSIVSVGFVTCLAQLLESQGDQYSPLNGVELVRKKVKCLYIQGGRFGEADESDFNFSQGITFAQTFFRLWPSDVDIIFSPQETGQEVDYTPEQVIADIDWTDIHPIKQVYLRCNCNTGQKMWDPMAVINAVEGDSLFVLSERGLVSILPNGETPFSPSPTGNCRYQMPGDDAWATTMLQKIRETNSNLGRQSR